MCQNVDTLALLRYMWGNIYSEDVHVHQVSSYRLLPQGRLCNKHETNVFTRAVSHFGYGHRLPPSVPNETWSWAKLIDVVETVDFLP